jgi:hypothetical protein
VTAQAPQLVVLVWGSTHCPLQQREPLAHNVPQAPQLVVSVWKLWHVPLQHDWPDGQTWPQLPQFEESRRVERQTLLQQAVPNVPQAGPHGPPTTT